MEIDRNDLFILCLFSNLQKTRSNDYQEGVSHIEQKPYFDWLDIWGWGQGAGDREVDRGEDHHAGDVDRVDKVKLNNC